VAGAGPEETGRVAAGLVDPAGSLHAPADYQRHLVGVLVARAVTRAVARATGASPDPGPGRPGGAGGSGPGVGGGRPGSRRDGQADGAEIATVEGLAATADERTLHPLQAAFKRHFALQCGFCTAGILMAAAELLDTSARPPDEDEIRRLLSGHLCRCTGYEPIVAAIGEVAMREDPAS